MSTVTDNNLRKEIEENLRHLPPAEWVRDMIDHYRRTGAFRPQDLRRLLGDPNRAVEVGPNSSLATFFSAKVGG
jgi:hypothetical protein